MGSCIQNEADVETLSNVVRIYMPILISIAHFCKFLFCKPITFHVLNYSYFYLKTCNDVSAV